MKRIVKASADPVFYSEQEIKDRILKAADSLSEPAKFHTSSVTIKGAKSTKTIRLSISQDHLGYGSTLYISDGARIEAEADSFEEAKQAFDDLADKYIRYVFRWRGRKLTDEEYRDLTNGL